MEREGGCGQKLERDEAALEFLVAHEQRAKAIKPAMADLSPPPSGLLRSVPVGGGGLFAASGDVREVATALEGAVMLRTTVSRIGTPLFVRRCGGSWRFTTQLASPSWSCLRS